MKKQKSNMMLPTVLFGILFAAAFIISYVSLRIEIEKLKKENLLLEESLSSKKNQRTMLQVEVQKLEAEERIVTAAFSKLGMVKSGNDEIKMQIDKVQVEQISRIVNGKYE